MMQHMQWDTPTRLEGSRASRELRRTYLNEMTVLGLRGLGSVFFQRSTDAGYIDFCRQSFEFSRGQHATNEPVEHERRGLSAVFLTTPSSAARRIKTSQKLTVGMLSTAPEGWGHPGSAVPGHSGHRDEGFFVLFGFGFGGSDFQFVTESRGWAAQCS